MLVSRNLCNVLQFNSFGGSSDYGIGQFICQWFWLLYNNKDIFVKLYLRLVISLTWYSHNPPNNPKPQLGVRPRSPFPLQSVFIIVIPPVIRPAYVWCYLFSKIISSSRYSYRFYIFKIATKWLPGIGYYFICIFE